MRQGLRLRDNERIRGGGGRSILAIPGLAWYSETNDTDALLVKAVQPVFADPNLQTGVGWTLGAGWSVGAGVANHVAGTTGTVYQPNALVGNRIRMQYQCVSATNTGVGAQIGATVESYATTLGVRSLETTAGMTTLGVASHSSSNAVVADFVPSNLSRIRWNPIVGAGFFSNASAAQQPWFDTARTMLRADPVDGLQQSNPAPWDILHSTAADCSLFIPIQCGTNSTNIGVVVGNVGLAVHGMAITYQRALQAIRLYFSNGAGVYETLTAPNNSTLREFVGFNGKHLIEYHKVGNTVEVISDGVQVIPPTVVARLSNTPSASAFSVLTNGDAGSATDSHLGGVRALYRVDSAMIPEDRAYVRDYFNAWVTAP